jgi:thiol-disulfide isomerase/thioredoxin
LYLAAANAGCVFRINSPLPSLDGVAAWRSARPSAGELAGNPVLVHFFSSGCALCHDGMPLVAEWRAHFAPRGLVVIAVYQPRSDIESTLADIGRECAAIVGSAHACAVDIRGVLAARFGNEWPPAYYVYDRSHRLRHFQMGNWHIERMAAVIEACVSA